MAAVLKEIVRSFMVVCDGAMEKRVSSQCQSESESIVIGVKKNLPATVAGRKPKILTYSSLLTLRTVTMKLLFTALSLWFPMAAAFTPSSSTQMKTQAPHISTSNYNSHIWRSYKVNNHNPSRTNNQWHLNAKSDAEKEEEERKKKVREEIFWAKQRAMAAEMEASSDAALKK